MKRFLTTGGIALLLACALTSHGVASKAVALPLSGKLLLTNVTIVDVRKGTLAEKQSLLAEGGKIVATGKAGLLKVDGPVQTVDAQGKFVVPGYNDMHHHVLGHGDDPTSNLALMLANGITGFRQMVGSPELLADRRAGALPLGVDAPALLQTAGAILTPLNASSPERAVAEVDAQKEQGADFVKCCMTNGEVFTAALAEGKKVGLPLLGHVPADVSVVTASKLGFKSIEHLGPSPGIAVACSTDEDALMKDAPGMPGALKFLRFVPFADALLERALKKMVINTALLAANPESFARMKRVMATFDEAKCRSVAAEFVANGTWVVPTLVRIRSSRLADDPAYANSPNLRYVSPKTVEAWSEVTEKFRKKIGPEDRATLRGLYALDLRLVKLLDAAGVKQLIGTDATGAGWLIPGFSIHDEFDEFAKAGITPLRVLQMTTLDAAEYLGRTGTMGTVEPGKAADLVLLDANPLENVQNLHRIDAVVRAGFYHSRGDLGALLANAAAHPAED